MRPFASWHRRCIYGNGMRYLALLLAGCATLTPQLAPCKTECGVRLFGSNDCAGFQEWERKAVKEYEKNVPQACDRLFGWVVYVQPTPTGDWVTAKGRSVRGNTKCREETMYLGTDVWESSSYAHEVLHALHCPFQDPDHEEWVSWQNESLKKVRGW